MLYEERGIMASEDEFLINERIMGACNHPDYSLDEERSYGHTYQLAICSKCGTRAHLSSSSFDKQNPLSELKRLVPRHCQDMIMARRVLRHIEDQGWRWSLQRRDGSFLYSFSNGAKRIEGHASRIELEAISTALVSLAKSLPHGLGG